MQNVAPTSRLGKGPLGSKLHLFESEEKKEGKKNQKLVNTSNICSYMYQNYKNRLILHYSLVLQRHKVYLFFQNTHIYTNKRGYMSNFDVLSFLLLLVTKLIVDFFFVCFLLLKYYGYPKSNLGLGVPDVRICFHS